MDLAVIPECYVDTNLIETLAIPSGNGYNHQKGCGTVARKMKNELVDSFALGIIDKDKHTLDYLNEFYEIINEGSLILYRHKEKAKHHYIIQINPAVEEFILANANSAGVSLTDYGLPDNLQLLRKEAKQQVSKKDDRFRRLFKAIRRAGTPDFQRLSQWVEYLRDNNYNADLEQIKEL